MAKEKKDTAAAAESPSAEEAASKATTKSAQTPKQVEPEYSARELAAAASSMGKNISPDVVTAVLRINRLTSATMSQAKRLVTQYIKQEVK